MDIISEVLLIAILALSLIFLYVIRKSVFENILITCIFAPIAMVAYLSFLATYPISIRIWGVKFKKFMNLRLTPKESAEVELAIITEHCDDLRKKIRMLHECHVKLLACRNGTDDLKTAHDVTEDIQHIMETTSVVMEELEAAERRKQKLQFDAYGEHNCEVINKALADLGRPDLETMAELANIRNARRGLNEQLHERLD